jgi:hypothetical protein
MKGHADSGNPAKQERVANRQVTVSGESTNSSNLADLTRKQMLILSRKSYGVN